MINRVLLVGRLTRDPEMRYTQSGIAVARFTLACDRPFGGQDGKKETDFIDCTVWRKQAENVAQYLKKGNMAGVDGRLQISSYEGQDGQKRQRAEVVADSVRFLEPKGQGQSSAPSQSKTANDHDAFSSDGAIDFEGELPF
ncbi:MULTISPECIES: single-stranded DNA-binding protein [unclassified Exiguobacterium]|uniref:single-stranded DNA-binding protein n=1 Tax=unclassified Exiguobacterium TaxID=2644629 RepID=UPI001BEBD469|nr:MULTISPECIES: single-stranded DNA-binding protein [unclassified Exiguobacterium]